MSKKLFTNWRFRTTTPTFEPGQQLELYLTGFDAGCGEARVGDTLIEIEGTSAAQIDFLVKITVQSFDKSTHRGKARITAQ